MVYRAPPLGPARPGTKSYGGSFVESLAEAWHYLDQIVIHREGRFAVNVPAER
ncbi:hypothetical protein [Streptomyces sp. AP-93]|uniref:hypothetical protein n=1 Tax=Streptomyces sp. AP-93 TaxID=2929048 RepID=UPI001FAFEF0D|nr:hypothetical protein [Streptomyces sp. AP-93]MCJ0875176.1 hypothetical protein [Streptomyces sp. AP-93]